jgi:hypothetical protein
VPLSERDPAAQAAPGAPDEADGAVRTRAVLDASGLKQPLARALLEWSAELALEREREAERRERDQADLLARLSAAKTAPSAGELAQLFADRAPYDPFKALGDTLRRRVPKRVLPSEGELSEILRASFMSVGLDAPIGSLSSVAALYERGDNRGKMLRNLTEVLGGKSTPTTTHRLIARVAARHVEREPAEGDSKYSPHYLIITTNYDRLIELALDVERAPYVVLTARRKDGKGIAVASPHVQDELFTRELARHGEVFPSDFAPQSSRPLVVLYKMHGSIGPGPLAEDSVVISDNDYVACLSWMTRNERMIPALVGNVLHGRPFLFLGYSLNDWNVRSFFRGAIEKRSGNRPAPDYAVLNRFTDFDRVFFIDNQVTILHTELAAFARKLLARLPAEYQFAP